MGYGPKSLTRVTKSYLLALGSTQISCYFTKHWTKFLTHQTGNYPVTCFVSKPSRITSVEFLILHHILQNSCRLFLSLVPIFLIFLVWLVLLCSRTRYASISLALPWLIAIVLVFLCLTAVCDHRICTSLGWRISTDTRCTDVEEKERFNVKTTHSHRNGVHSSSVHRIIRIRILSSERGRYRIIIIFVVNQTHTPGTDFNRYAIVPREF